MPNFFIRIISGVVYSTLFIVTTLYSKESYIALIVLFGFISLFEFLKMIQLKSLVPYLFLVFLGHTAYNKPENNLIWIILSLCLLAAIRLIAYLYTEKQNYPKHYFEKLDLTVRYISFSFLFLLLIPFYKGKYIPKIILGVLIIIWINDSFAYLIGKNFGKRKLFKRISPRKTIEGFIGGLLFAMASSFILAKFFPVFSLLNWLIITIIVAIFGTLGDLIESKFKRRANIKDSGNIMPGHGGILDRLDSLLFASPFVYLYINYFV